MVQAARSGRQNIAEGSRASSTSSQTELRLVNVARASLDELLLDYEDFLRQRGLRVWTKDDRDAMEVREIAAAAEHLSDPSDPTDRSDPTDPSEKTSPARSPFGPYNQWLTHADPAVVANAIICLIHQANYLLDRQISSLEEHFISHGGYSEQLAAARISERGRLQGSTAKTHTTSPAPEQTLPACPLCAKPMRLCTARIGSKTGERFWGCSAYPDCRGTRRVVTS
jgi:four helix bundle suffix protein